MHIHIVSFTHPQLKLPLAIFTDAHISVRICTYTRVHQRVHLPFHIDVRVMLLPTRRCVLEHNLNLLRHLLHMHTLLNSKAHVLNKVSKCCMRKYALPQIASMRTLHRVTENMVHVGGES